MQNVTHFTLQVNVGRAIGSGPDKKHMPAERWLRFIGEVSDLFNNLEERFTAETVAKAPYSCEIWREESYFRTATLPDTDQNYYEARRTAIDFARYLATKYGQDSIAVTLSRDCNLVGPEK